MGSAASMSGIRLKLPATSANLGPGFDAAGLAMRLYLTVAAEVAADGQFAIEATGRDSAVCGSLTGNLTLDTYTDVLRQAGREAVPLTIVLHNEIPLGMGCGSSAAALLAGVLLANHFGELGWTGYEAMEEACRREGHPDNVAACWLGGMTVSAAGENGFVTASFGAELKWKLMLVVPAVGLATTKARALLPEMYPRGDAVQNVQHAALLVAAFAQDRPELLRTAMMDRLHQPYRMAACPLLPLLLPMAGESGVMGVALSGAGPSVLLICDSLAELATIGGVVRKLVAAGHSEVELIETLTAAGTEVEVTEVMCTTLG